MPWNARKMMLYIVSMVRRLVLIDNLQRAHVLSCTAADREAREQQPRDYEKRSSAVDVTQLGKSYREAYEISAFSVSFRYYGHYQNKMKRQRTQVGKQIGQRNPGRVDEILKVQRDGHQGGRDNGRVETREEKAQEEAIQM